MYVCVYVRTYVRTYKRTYVCMYVCIYVCVDVCICLSVYLSICLSVYLSIYLSIYRSIYLSIYLSIDLLTYCFRLLRPGVPLAPAPPTRPPSGAMSGVKPAPAARRHGQAVRGCRGFLLIAGYGSQGSIAVAAAAQVVQR